MLKRGQAAMEFMMTYGWAILAVLITIGALAYFGVLSPALFLPESCVLFPGVACTDMNVGRNAAVLTVQNGIGSTLNNFEIEIPNTGCKSSPIILGDGQKTSIAVGGVTCTIPGKNIRKDLTIKYSVGSLSHTRFGKIAAEVGPGNMVAYYSFEPGTIIGTAVKDLSGFGNDGTLNGGVNCNVPGANGIGKGCSFSGGYVVIPDDESLEGMSELTLEIWIKFNALTGTWNHMIEKDAGYALTVSTLSNEYMYSINGVSGPLGCGWFPTGVAPTIGFWDHVVMTYDGSTMRLYKNDLEVNSFPCAIGNIVDSPDVVNIAHPTTYLVDGTIDEVRIYDYAIR